MEGSPAYMFGRLFGHGEGGFLPGVKGWGAPSDAEMADRLAQLMNLVSEKSQPNLNALRIVANAIDPLSFNIKQLGYSLAQQLAAALPVPTETSARIVGLLSGLSTQAAIESDWVAHWCRELQIPVVFHRKIWELCFALQAIYETGCIRPGARGLGFGCGMEPLPSYLAAQGVKTTVTDLEPESAAAQGWVDTNQHAGGLESTFMANLVSREAFDEHVDFRFVDMNAIPDDLQAYDFCWSICALEHLGSIDAGLAFIENSLRTLAPGGVAVHTTEFNIRDDGPTIDNWPTVVFQRKHFEELVARLEAQGHIVAPLDFSLGDKPLDRFVDLPPYHHDLPEAISTWIGAPAHLKLAYDGLVVTCIGLKVMKAS